MNLEEYKGIIKETAIFPQKVENFGLAYAWLGLQGETTEAINAFYVEVDRADVEDCKDYYYNVRKELGDVCWYTTAIAEELGLSLSEIFSDIRYQMMKDEDTPTLMEYSEKIKKYYRDGKEINTKELTNVLNKNIWEIVQVGRVFNEEIDLEEVLEMNYDKLMSRKKRKVLQGDGDNR